MLRENLLSKYFNDVLEVSIQHEAHVGSIAQTLLLREEA